MASRSSACNVGERVTVLHYGCRLRHHVSVRPVIIAANWKMNTTPADAGELARTIASRTAEPAVERVICPPFVCLAAVGEALAGTGVAVGAQDVHHEAAGAYTGDISAAMLDGRLGGPRRDRASELAGVSRGGVHLPVPGDDHGSHRHMMPESAPAVENRYSLTDVVGGASRRHPPEGAPPGRGLRGRRGRGDRRPMPSSG